MRGHAHANYTKARSLYGHNRTKSTFRPVFVLTLHQSAVYACVFMYMFHSEYQNLHFTRVMRTFWLILFNRVRVISEFGKGPEDVLCQ